jgi:hypothetical protein
MNGPSPPVGVEAGSQHHQADGAVVDYYAALGVESDDLIEAISEVSR